MARDGKWIVWMGMWTSSAVLAPLGIFHQFGRTSYFCKFLIVARKFNMSFLGPVSYTHLDVYKRQEHNLL